MIAGLPFHKSLDKDEFNLVENVSKDEYFAIDLSEYGTKIYGFPSTEAGERLLTADLNKTNPEELGPYLEGDVLIPYPLSRSGMRSRSLRWSRGRIPYVLSEDLSDFDVEQIYLAIEQYHKYTCIHLEPKTDTDEDYIEFTNDRSGCWASLGRIGGRQQVNVQSGACTNRLGTVIHEIMHAVGFMHEQNRPDRDDWVQINYENIRSGAEDNFQKLSSYYATTFNIPYDYNSVMHYNAYSFSKSGEATIVPLNDIGDVDMGQRKQMSQLDIKKVNAMYKCSGKKSRIP